MASAVVSALHGIRQNHPIAGDQDDLAVEFEFQQCRHHGSSGELAAPQQFVNIRWCGSKQSWDDFLGFLGLIEGLITQARIMNDPEVLRQLPAMALSLLRVKAKSAAPALAEKA